MGLQRLAILGLGVLLLTYVGFLIYAIGFEPSSRTDSAAIETGAARVVGENAIRQLSSDWTEANLKKIVDPRMHEQLWFKDLADKLPIFNEDLGEVVSINSKVEPSRRESDSIAKLYTLSATTQHTKGTSKSKLLLFWDSQKWGILLIEFQVEKTYSKPNLETEGT